MSLSKITFEVTTASVHHDVLFFRTFVWNSNSSLWAEPFEAVLKVSCLFFTQ